jgi:ATP-dependent DNA helicase DinG
MTTSQVVAALRAVTSALPAAEERPGQVAMAEAVATAIESGRHLVVQAGTGTGKTIGYLVPGILAGKRVVVATATKALQDQLAAKDLPFLQEHLDHPFGWAVLKGRSNYVCRQRVTELEATDSGQGTLEIEEFGASLRGEIDRLLAWSRRTPTGDRAELDWAPSERAWQAVTVGSDECPGGSRCPQGGVCFSETARHAAAEADVIVVNLHLYGLDVAASGAILPEHDVVVVDEAHQLEDVMSDTVGVQITGGRFTGLAAALRRILDDPAVVAPIAEAPQAVRDTLGPLLNQRLTVPLPTEVNDLLLDLRNRTQAALTALRAIDTTVDEARQRVLRGQQLATRAIEALDVALGPLTRAVPFVGGGPDFPRLEIAPLDVGPVLAQGVWEQRTAVLTSATIPTSLSRSVGLASDGVDEIDVGSPFDYEHHGLLYCAMHLPEPRSAAFPAAMHDELVALIEAADGRTLALFTSWKAMDAAAEAVRARLPHRILTQRDLPKPALVREFSADEQTCLFATAGFFQGVDIPGRTLSLVVIDKIPFPRPDDPLLSARREELGAAAFAQIDIPRASMLLAQATGRLIRTATDRGVVAVMDRRLGTAGYRWDIVKALPPMRRTRERAEAVAFLGDITGQASSR